MISSIASHDMFSKKRAQQFLACTFVINKQPLVKYLLDFFVCKHFKMVLTKLVRNVLEITARGSFNGCLSVPMKRCERSLSTQTVPRPPRRGFDIGKSNGFSLFGFSS